MASIRPSNSTCIHSARLHPLIGHKRLLSICASRHQNLPGVDMGKSALLVELFACKGLRPTMDQQIFSGLSQISLDTNAKSYTSWRVRCPETAEIIFTEAMFGSTSRSLALVLQMVRVLKHMQAQTRQRHMLLSSLLMAQSFHHPMCCMQDTAQQQESRSCSSTAAAEGASGHSGGQRTPHCRHAGQSCRSAG